MKREVTLTVLLLSVCSRALAEKPQIQWRDIEPGVQYAAIEIEPPSGVGEKKLHAVRIDPTKAKLAVFLASEHPERGKIGRKAGQWCEEFNLSVAINAGMYQGDFLSNVGYLRNGDHKNNPRWAKSYKSALAFTPIKPDIPGAVLLDLDADGARERLDQYGTVIQNLRLIKADGRNVWSKSEKRWSEASVAMDGDGRLLFLLCRAPYAMWEFNNLLLSLPLGVVAAMHVEGGPEASLSIRSEGLNMDLCGSFETGFNPDDRNVEQWPIPNAIGVLKAGGSTEDRK